MRDTEPTQEVNNTELGKILELLNYSNLDLKPLFEFIKNLTKESKILNLEDKLKTKNRLLSLVPELSKLQAVNTSDIFYLIRAIIQVCEPIRPNTNLFQTSEILMDFIYTRSHILKSPEILVYDELIELARRVDLKRGGRNQQADVSKLLSTLEDNNLDYQIIKSNEFLRHYGIEYLCNIETKKHIPSVVVSMDRYFTEKIEKNFDKLLNILVTQFSGLKKDLLSGLTAEDFSNAFACFLDKKLTLQNYSAGEIQIDLKTANRSEISFVRSSNIYTSIINLMIGQEAKTPLKSAEIAYIPIILRKLLLVRLNKSNLLTQAS